MYVHVTADEPLHQGDIFRSLPLTVANIAQSPVRRRDGALLIGGWVANSTESDLAIELGAQATWAILANQDCDAAHSPLLTFFAIVPLSSTGITLRPQPQKRWRGIIKEFKANVKYFYMRKEAAIPFQEPMAASFGQVLLLHRGSVDQQKGNLRQFRLSDEALIHFRESVARYFTRLAYDERYSFDDEERTAYDHDHADSE